jgi:hypothetical protein
VLVDIVVEGQLGGAVARDGAYPDQGRGLARGRSAAVRHDDAGKGVGVLEDGRVAEVQDLLELRPFA